MRFRQVMLPLLVHDATGVVVSVEPLYARVWAVRWNSWRVDCIWYVRVTRGWVVERRVSVSVLKDWLVDCCNCVVVLVVFCWVCHCRVCVMV